MGFFSKNVKQVNPAGNNVGIKDINPSEKVYIFRSELEFISKCILDYPDIETGGNMFGYWTNSGAPVVHYVLGPGEKASHNVAFFRQDNDYLQEVGGKLISKYALQHIGEWHSHHRLGLAHPSGHDSSSIHIGMKSVDMDKFLLCIGVCNSHSTACNPFLYSDKVKEGFSLNWALLEGVSPIRKDFDLDCNSVLMPLSTESNLDYDYMGILKKPKTDSIWLFSDSKNQVEFKKVFDSLSEKNAHCRISLEQDNTISLFFGKEIENFKLSFPKDFPKSVPLTYELKEDSFVEKEILADWSDTESLSCNLLKYLEKIECLNNNLIEE